MENLTNEFISPNADEVNTGVDTNQNYIDTIKSLKENSVSKAEYEKLRKENQSLLQTLVEGGQIEQPVDKEPVDINALRKELFNEDCDLSNLDYVSKALKLRDALIEKGEPDPFLPVSSKDAPTQEEINIANSCAEIFRECIEYSDGNSQLFTQELMRRTIDSSPRGRR